MKIDREKAIAEFERMIKEADHGYGSVMDDLTIEGAKIILQLLKEPVEKK